MAKRAKASSGADLGFEAQLWKAADALRSNMDAAAYKHVVLGLIFLKYDRARDAIGRVSKYLLAKIAAVASKLCREFSALRRIVRHLVERLEACSGRVYYTWGSH